MKIILRLKGIIEILRRGSEGKESRLVFIILGYNDLVTFMVSYFVLYFEEV